MAEALRRDCAIESNNDPIRRAYVQTDEFLRSAFARRLHVLWSVALSTGVVGLLVVGLLRTTRPQVTDAQRQEWRATKASSRELSFQTHEPMAASPMCPFGRFGDDCQHSLKTFYFEHDVYAGFQPSPDAKLTGWSPDKSFYQRIVATASAKLIIEVGVWRGLSLVHLASSLKELTGGGAVIAVDTWLGAPEFWNRRHTNGGKDSERDLKWKHGYPQVYYDFLSNVVMRHLEDVVIPLPVPSLIAAQLLLEKGILADVIHIDAAHEYESVREDIQVWYPLLAADGILLGDDFDQYWPGVVQAACEFAREISVKVHCSGNKWWIKKSEARVNDPSRAESIESCTAKALSQKCTD